MPMSELQLALITEARQLRERAQAIRVVEHTLHDEAKQLSEEAWKLIDEAHAHG